MTCTQLSVDFTIYSPSIPLLNILVSSPRQPDNVNLHPQRSAARVQYSPQGRSQSRMGYFVSIPRGFGCPVADLVSCSSLASAGNELKLQGTGSGLDDLEEEFMDGR
jgi:hypothetical protein